MKKLLIGIVIFLLIGTAFYFGSNMGTSEKVKLTVSEEQLISLKGIYYRGTPQDPALKTAFDRVQEVLEKAQGGHLHTIYYVEPAGKLDTMEVFVGIEKALLVSEGWDEKEIACAGSVVAEISGNPWLMPGPNKVKKMIREYAEENKFKLQDVFIDQIISPEQVRVIAPIKTQ